MNETQVDTVNSPEKPLEKQTLSWRGLWNRLLVDGDPSEGTPVQFGLRSILLLQAAAACTLTLLMMLDLLGVFILFLGTVLIMFCRASPAAARGRRVASDLLAGALMPVICLVFDPGVIRNNLGGGLEILLVSAILVQVAGLLLWQLVPAPSAHLAALFAGFLSFGFVLAAAIGIGMLPLTLMGLLLLVGFLGTMPFLTAIVYLRNALSASRIASRMAGKTTRLPAFVLGMALAILVPYLLANWQGAAISNIYHSLPHYGLRWL